MPTFEFTTAMDGGSAENAGEVFCRNCLEQFWTPARRSAGRPTGRGSQIPVQVWHSINQIRATYSFEYSANQVTPTPLISKAGIIAHHKDDAEAIFKEKIKFVYDQLDPAIKQHVSATTDRAGKIVFSNGRVSG
jgi:hypothetical protein